MGYYKCNQDASASGLTYSVATDDDYTFEVECDQTNTIEIVTLPSFERFFYIDLDLLAAEQSREEELIASLCEQFNVIDMLDSKSLFEKVPVPRDEWPQWL